MYRETLRVEEIETADTLTIGNGKVNKICNSILEALSGRNANAKNMITAQVCKNPPDLDAGLVEIVRLRGKGMIPTFRCYCFSTLSNIPDPGS